MGHAYSYAQLPGRNVPMAGIAPISPYYVVSGVVRGGNQEAGFRILSIWFCNNFSIIDQRLSPSFRNPANGLHLDKEQVAWAMEFRQVLLLLHIHQDFYDPGMI